MKGFVAILLAPLSHSRRLAQVRGLAQFTPKIVDQHHAHHTQPVPRQCRDSPPKSLSQLLSAPACARGTNLSPEPAFCGLGDRQHVSALALLSAPEVVELGARHVLFQRALD